MEFELQHATVNCFERVLETTVFQEETQEAIVPDAYPDILRILEVRAYACLTGKQVRDNMVLVTGLIHSSVFYLPEGDHSVKKLEIATPFTCQTDAHGITPTGTVFAFPSVRWAEARALNPRKILLRVDLAAEIKAWKSHQMVFCCQAVSQLPVVLQQLHSEETCSFISSVSEKPFTFSDTINFDALHAPRSEVLNLHAMPCCHESRLIGNKLIFKGSVELDILLCIDGELKSLRQSMPFSQIMEVPDMGESCSSEVRITLTDLVFHPDDASSNSGMLTVELLAQAVILEQRSMTLLRDLYSTSHHMDAKTETHILCRFMEQNTKTVSVRELLETTTSVRTAVYGWADVREVHLSGEGEHRSASAQVQINVLYQDDAQQLQSVHKILSVDCPVDCVSGGTCQCWCPSPAELFITPSAGGLEIRFTQTYHCTIAQNCQSTVISSAELGEERPRYEQSRPSVILRLASPGERLWDIAKHYVTTQEEIMQANELEDDSIPAGKMLLIPRTR